MKDRSDDPSHHERTLLPRNYVSLLASLDSTRVLLYASSPRQDNTYHGATSRSLSYNNVTYYAFNMYPPIYLSISFPFSHPPTHTHTHMGTYLGEKAPMTSPEIAPLSKHMTPAFFITITSAKKIMTMQLLVAKYYYSWKVGEFLFYFTKPMFKPLKMSIG